MEKEEIYKLTKEDVEKLVAIIMVRVVLAAMSKDHDSLSPEKIKSEVFMYLDEKVKK